MGHNHSHGHHKHEIQGKNLVISIILNVIITGLLFVGGLLSGSLSLLSDALHNLSDVITLLISWFANKLSKKQANYYSTFGYKRAEILSAFVNSILLIAVAIYLIFGAIERFRNPVSIESNLVIILAFSGIILNGLSVLLLKKDAEHNMNMKSAYLHLLTDVMASIAVLIGGLLMKYFGWFWVDSVLSVAISMYLINVGYKLLIESSKMLMLFTPKNIDIKELIAETDKILGVNKLHHIHVWHLNDDELHLEAHLDCSEDIKMSEFNILLEKIEHVLFDKFDINHINIQPEFKKDDSKDFIVQD